LPRDLVDDVLKSIEIAVADMREHYREGPDAGFCISVPAWFCDRLDGETLARYREDKIVIERS